MHVDTAAAHTLLTDDVSGQRPTRMHLIYIITCTVCTHAQHRLHTNLPLKCTLQKFRHTPSYITVTAATIAHTHDF